MQYRTKEIKISSPDSISPAGETARQFAIILGFGYDDQVAVGTAMRELAKTIINGGMSGFSIKLSTYEHSGRNGIEIRYNENDRGKLKFQGMLTTYIRNNVQQIKNIMDEVVINSAENEKVEVIVHKFFKAASPAAGNTHQASAFSLPAAGQAYSGDAHLIKWLNETKLFVALVDSLETGEAGYRTSTGVLKIIEDDCSKPLLQVAAKCHNHLTGSAGAHLGMMTLDFKSNTMDILSVGDITFKVMGNDAQMHFQKTTGVVGKDFKPFILAGAKYRPGTVWVMHSQGIKCDIERGSDDPLWKKMPKEIAMELVKCHRLTAKDATTIVAV